MLQKSILFFLLLASTLQAHSLSKDQCTTVDISNHMGPVRDQGEIGWCFAFTAADLMTQHLKLKPEDRISALDIASSYYQQSPDELKKQFHLSWAKYHGDESPGNFKAWKDYYYRMSKQSEELPRKNFDRIEGGFTDLVVISTNNRGYCTEKELLSENSPVFQNQSQFLFQKIFETKSDLEAKRNNIECRFTRNHFKPFFAIQELSDSIEAKRVQDVFREINKQCQKRLRTLPMIPYTFDDTPENNMKVINEALDQNKVPAIAYDSKKLFGNHSRSHTVRGTHASTIVGRKWNSKTKQCEFKLRNTWGPNWCPNEKFSKDRCENGNVWLTAPELQPFLTSVTVIK